MSSSTKPKFYLLKRLLFTLLVILNLFGCIAFGLLACYINNNFNAVWYVGSKPIESATEAFIIGIAVIGVLFHALGLYGSHREHVIVTKIYGFLTLAGLIYSLYRAITSRVFLLGLVWYSTTGFCLLTTLSTIWFVLDLELLDRSPNRYQAFLR